jgi:hypothetical protein
MIAAPRKYTEELRQRANRGRLRCRQHLHGAPSCGNWIWTLLTIMGGAERGGLGGDPTGGESPGVV